ncbi:MULTISPECIES: hypothetical protein [Actinobacillus]|uniref:Uncharacterized protein n=2 Tax=Actinobacillus suis TaxID=716 RepID=K0GAH5_ACTSU|nr:MULTISPECIES: hypothetical protein [Actinobacillus]AFU18655.1 hypothetical protein ASU2_02565 [Actinobacillus suis H91-0380]EFM95259.1 hypothetical protein appser10_21190 [Actinobacillus pleuropneumoniae serovar 10 str. D13039]MCO4167110.1 hypothetical protein [Actinobacillus suis]MCO4169233.1 hypothetical protein [Actinobacillus suis]MCQ9629837.1 hypothetical protein [Actinobacillus suis]
MISEQDKQAILNGAFGKTRDGRKAKFIDRRPDGCPVFAIIKGECLSECKLEMYTTSFKIYSNKETNSDIIGLWQDKPEPFDLEQALAGNPLIDLHNNEKCWLYKSHNNGKLIIEYENEYDGDSDLPKISFISEENNLTDCFGMWKDPELQLSSNSLQLPKPVTEPLPSYAEIYYLNIENCKYVINQIFYKDIEFIGKLLENRMLYRTKEEVIQVIEAITGKPYEDR